MTDEEIKNLKYLIVGDVVSLRKWLEKGVNREGVGVVGKITKVWRSGECKSGIMVRVKTGLSKWVDLDSTWVTPI